MAHSVLLPQPGRSATVRAEDWQSAFAAQLLIALPLEILAALSARQPSPIRLVILRVPLVATLEGAKLRSMAHRDRLEILAAPPTGFGRGGGGTGVYQGVGFVRMLLPLK